MTSKKHRHGDFLASLLKMLKNIDPVIVAALVLGIIVRSYEFGNIPPGLNQDEASTAYDAYALLNYGIDRNGYHNPVMLVAWGSGMYALAAYAAMPFIWLFGLSEFSARLPHLLAGIITLPLFYQLLLNTIDRRTAQIGVLLLAISPWHIMVSRWGLDSNLFPFIFLVGTLLAVRSFKKPIALIAACIVYGLSLYAYGTSYVVVPLFLVLLFAYGTANRLWPLRYVITAIIAFTVIAMPIGLYVLQWQEIETPFFSIPLLSGTPRFQTMGNTNVFSSQFYENAVDNVSNALHLFSSQNDGMIWNAIPDYGILYPFSGLLAVLGVCFLCARCLRRKRDNSVILLFWLISAVVLTAFVSVNINRANIAMLPFVFLVAITISMLSRYRGAIIVLGMLFLFSFFGFIQTYFTNYRAMAAPAFFASFGEAIEYTSSQTEGDICVTGNVNMPYIFVLFYTREDPWVFLESVNYSNPGAEFQGVSSFGRYTFGIDRCKDTADIIIVTHDEESQLDSSSFAFKRFERYSVATRQR